MKSLLGQFRSTLYSLSVSGKILAIVATSSLVTLSLMCSVSLYRDWQSFRNRKVSAMQTFAEIMERNTVASLRFDDPYIANEYVETLKREPDIDRVTIFDQDDNVFAQYSRIENLPPLAVPRFTGKHWQGDHLLYAQNIMLENKRLGTLLIEANTDSLKEAVGDSILLTFILFLGGLLISLVLAARMQKLITSPVSELLDVTKTVRSTEDITRRAIKKYNDEIGALVESFNMMLDRISERDVSLRDMNAKLERTVAERTNDLQLRNEELERAMAAAKAASVAKSEFLATTSHELRTPLNPIIGYVEKLLRDDPEGPQARELNLIRSSAQQLLRLIEDILDFSRIERGTLQLGEDNVDPQELCRSVVKLLEPQAREKGISLTYQTDSASLEGPVLVDEGRLRQVVLNLVNNAVKFTHRGSVTVVSSIFKDEKDRNALRIEVKDTGIGISPENQKRLFKPFSQIDASSTREYGGMGLGLAISQKIVCAMGGTIECESEKGAGSTFAFEMPAAAAPPLDKPTKDPEQETIPWNTNARVLLVEDERVNRELMDTLITGIGHSVTSAKNGLEAVELANQQPFDFILIDISMPKLDGIEATKRIRAAGNVNSGIPIIAMTAHATPEDKRRCFQAGMNDYLSKPISFTKLKSTLEKWFDRKAV